MKLHQSLADLARDHGQGLFRDAAAFRGSLDDYLDEGQASSGTINLLTDAVRLGALDGMLSMLDSGASPSDAVESAGQRLARDRGSADVRGCQWALSVLGFALGKVPEHLVTGLDPEAGTTAPPAHGPGGTAPAQPFASPPHQPITSPVAPPQQPIVSSPPQQFAAPSPTPAPSSYGAAPPYGSAQQPSYGAGGWSQPTPPKKKGNTGLIVGAVVLALVVIIGGIVGIVALSGDDDDPKADDPTSQDTTTGSDGPTSDDPESDDTDPPEDGPNGDLGGPDITGLGYVVSTPSGWMDGTEEFSRQNPNLTTLDKIFWWGDTFNTARGNVIVETQSSFGSTDPSDLEENWKSALTSSDPSAEIYDLPDITIDGQSALTVEIDRPSNNVKQRAHLVISGDKGYSITVTYRNGDSDVPNEFDEILDTWNWTN